MKKKLIIGIVGTGILVLIGLVVFMKIYATQAAKTLQEEIHSFLESHNTQDTSIEFEPFVCSGSTSIVCKSPKIQINFTQTKDVVRLENITLELGGNKTQANINLDTDIYTMSDMHFHSICDNNLKLQDALLALDIQCNTTIKDLQQTQNATLFLTHPSFNNATLQDIIKNLKNNQKREEMAQDISMALMSYKIHIHAPSIKNAIQSAFAMQEDEMRTFSVVLALMESTWRKAQGEDTKEFENALADVFKIAKNALIDDTIQDIFITLTTKTPDSKKFLNLQEIETLNLSHIAQIYTLTSQEQ